MVIIYVHGRKICLNNNAAAFPDLSFGCDVLEVLLDLLF